MYALKSNLKNYTAIFLLYYVLRCITIVSTHPSGLYEYINLPVNYDINRPHNQRALIANSNDGEYLQMPSREQHPWERRPLHHQNNLDIKTQTSEFSSEECVQSPTESRTTINAPIHGFTHRDRLFPAMRLNGNALDTEIGAYDQHHPWRMQRAHRMVRFHYRGWPTGHFEPDNDESNEENEQGDTTADRAKTPGNNWREKTPCRRHRFHHRRWPAGHFEPDNDELNEENEQGDTFADRAKTPGNNWRESLEPMNTNGGSSKEEAEMDSTTAATGAAKTPCRRHRFHHRRWLAGHFERDNDESNEENEQADTTADRAKTPGNNWRESLEPMDTNGGSPKEDVEMDSTTAATSAAKTPCRRHRFHYPRWHAGHFEPANDELNEENEQGGTTADRAKTPCRRHRFHHRRWPAGHFEPHSDESNEENEQGDTTADRAKTHGNNWREPLDTNGGSPKKDAEVDSTTATTGKAKETTTPTTIATTAISEESTTLMEKTTNSQEVETTTVVNSLTTPTTDNTNTLETTEAAQSIDIRSGFA